MDEREQSLITLGRLVLRGGGCKDLRREERAKDNPSFWVVPE